MKEKSINRVWSLWGRQEKSSRWETSKTRPQRCCETTLGGQFLCGNTWETWLDFLPGAAYTFMSIKVKIFPGQQTHSECIFQLGDVRSFSLNGGEMMSSRWMIFRVQNGFARNNSVNLARWVAQILTSWLCMLVFPFSFHLSVCVCVFVCQFCW